MSEIDDIRMDLDDDFALDEECQFGHDEIDECDECGGCRECGNCYCGEDDDDYMNDELFSD
jgi:hypothetical protein